MKKLNIKKLCYGAIMAVALVFAPFLGKKAYAEDAIRYVDLNPATDPTWSVYLEDGRVCIETYDREHTSHITYKTEGFTISRCVLGSKELWINDYGTAGQYVAMPVYENDSLLDEQVVLSNGKTYMHNIWRYNLDSIIELIESAGYTEWAWEIKSYYYNGGNTVCYLKFDSCMTTYVDGRPEGRFWFDVKDAWGDDDGQLDCFGKTYTKRPFEYDNPEKIMGAYQWADGSRLIYHYDRYLPEISIEPPQDEEEIVVSDKASNFYEIKNEGIGFDVSVAIPASEQVRNTMSASSLVGEDMSYGIVTVPAQTYNAIYQCTMSYEDQTATLVPRTEVAKYVYKKGQMIGTWNVAYDDTNSYEVVETKNPLTGAVIGKIVYRKEHYEYETETKTEYQTVTIPMTAKNMQYQYIASKPSLYEFEKLTVYNGHFPENYSDLNAAGNPQRTIVYTKANAHVPNVSTILRVYSQEALRYGNTGYVPIRQHMGSDPATYNYTPLGEAYHYDYYQILNVTDGVPTYGYTAYDTINITGSQSGDWSNLVSALQYKVNTLAQKISDSSWTRNDHFFINDGVNTFTIMSDTKVYGCDVEANIAISYDGTFLGTVGVDTINSVEKPYVGSANTSNKYGGNGVTLKSIREENKASRATGTEIITIPYNADNVDYPTAATVVYRDLITQATTKTSYAGLSHFTGAGVDDIYEHVMADGKGAKHMESPSDFYPIRVHTPIVTPITIVDGNLMDANEPTQLVPDKINITTEHQLKLDKSYFIKWVDDIWVSGVWQETPQGYEDVFDKYVKAKFMRFPFDVVYENVYYEVDATSGKTDWIEVLEPYYYADSPNPDGTNYTSDNHWQYTPFYIPSTAKEVGERGADAYVEVMVQANNVEGRDAGNHSSAITVLKNALTDFYAARTDKQVQLSGWIYDFSIVGTENGQVYNGNLVGNYDSNDAGYDPYPLSEWKLEIKSNAFTRNGNSGYRYLTDGSWASGIIDECMFPLRDGSSLNFSSMGAVWKGQDFAYTLKTIGTLDGPRDSIEIVPSYTFITPDGEVLRSADGDFKMYVLDAYGDYEGYEYNPSDWDITTNARSVQLADELFKESYYDADDSNYFQNGNWVVPSVANENADLGLGGLLVVDEQEYMYRKNYSYTISHVSIPATLRYLSGEYEQLGVNDGAEYTRGGNSTLTTYESINGYDAELENRFIYSMQQWQSKFVIPIGLKVIDTRTLGGSSFDLDNYIDSQQFWHWDTDPNVYSNKGKLIIHFDIYAYKDGEPYLQYNGAGLNMWDVEGYTDRTIEIKEWGNTVGTVTTGDGDIVIVDMSQNVSTYYEGAIFNIN